MASLIPQSPADPAQPKAESSPQSNASWPRPWVQLKYFSYHPCIFPSMIRDVSPDAKPGQMVTVMDRNGQPFGHGLYNPKARVPLRVFFHGETPRLESDFLTLLDQAAQLRLDSLRLAETTDAYRVVHSDGDSLSGLIVDRFADVLSVECHSLGVYQRLPVWLPRLHETLGTRRTVVDVDPKIARMEGIRPTQSIGDAVRSVKVREHGIRYEVDFEAGHKTGFFCDQRDNRRQFGAWVKGQARVLDLCCYTGGFALAAKLLGQAGDVTGVDLDEKAIEQAKRNANLNQARVQWIHVDAFSYARQMQRNGDTWNAVVLDPPKLILSRDEFEEGRRKYEDLNVLAMSLVAPGGLFVTCSCSGLFSEEDFERAVIRAAHRQARRLQILDRTGAGPDHPVMSNCPESRYLKVIWARAL